MPSTTLTTTCRACHRERTGVVAGLCRPCRGRRDHRRGLRIAREGDQLADLADQLGGVDRHLPTGQMLRLAA